MQAIVTRFIPCTNTKPSRIKAWCNAGSVIVSKDSAPSHMDAEDHAFRTLLKKIDDAAEKRHGTPDARRWESAKWHKGFLPDNMGSNSHVYVREE